MMTRRNGYLIRALCVIYSLIAGLYPFEFADRTRHFGTYPWNFLTTFFVPIQDVRLNDFLQNIAYFLPWGIISYVLVDSPHRRPVTRVLLAALVGGVVSLTIEACQYFVSRHPSVFDVLANMVGATLGALLCALSSVEIKQLLARFFARAQRSRVLLLIVVAYGAVPLAVSFSKPRWFDFPNWDSSYTFQLANEATLDRPWLGRLYLAAIYNRALKPEEIVRNYQAGTSSEAHDGRTKNGLVVYYTFAEGHGAEVGDVSGYGRPLNLTLFPSSHFRWLGGNNGIEIVQPAVLTNAGPAEKLYEVLKASKELSIEVWMAPSNVTQNGPARIVSFSRDTIARNFTLGQVGVNIDFRLRTPVSGSNGTKLNLRTTDGPVALGKSHVVITYKDGVERLYIGGRISATNSSLKQAEIIAGFGTKKNPISQIAFGLFYFFPVSLFLAFFLSGRRRSFIITLCVPATIAFGLLSVTEIFQAYNITRAIDSSMFGYGIASVAIGAFSGAMLGRKGRATNRSSLVTTIPQPVTTGSAPRPSTPEE
jgi:VanZ family protein